MENFNESHKHFASLHCFIQSQGDFLAEIPECGVIKSKW